MNPNLITAYLVDLINSSDMPDHKRDEGLLYARQLRACPNIDGLRSCVSDQNRLIWAYQGTIELIQRGQLPRIEKQEVPPRRQAWMLLEYAMKVETGHSMGRVFKCGPRQMSTERGAAVRILHQDYNYAYRGIAQRIGCSFGSFFYLEKKAEAILMAARLRDIMWDAYTEIMKKKPFNVSKMFGKDQCVEYAWTVRGAVRKYLRHRARLFNDYPDKLLVADGNDRNVREVFVGGGFMGRNRIERLPFLSLVYGSVCSGIEACSVAWKGMGFKTSFLSEIARFPRAVLSYHYPETTLYGDFTKIQHDAAIDILVGGTPCQSFSIAGLRGGLDDDRGNLALEYLRLADRIRPQWIIWENVPGVLSSNRGRDFGAFLGGMGHIGYGWAYRVLDAQYFGVPQRRRRVFVVGHSSGDWRRAASVLFESQGLRRDSSPRKKRGQELPNDLRVALESVAQAQQEPLGPGTEKNGAETRI